MKGLLRIDQKTVKWVHFKDIISVREAVIANAWRYEQAEIVLIMSRNQMTYEEMEIFMLAIEQRKPRIYALLITEHGKATEKLQGIVTPWDLLSPTHELLTSPDSEKFI